MVKCFRFRTFLEKPSIFHVKEENVEEDGIGEAVDWEASITRVDLSNESLILAEKAVIQDFLI